MNETKSRFRWLIVTGILMVFQLLMAIKSNFNIFLFNSCEGLKLKSFKEQFYCLFALCKLRQTLKTFHRRGFQISIKVSQFTALSAKIIPIGSIAEHDACKERNFIASSAVESLLAAKDSRRETIRSPHFMLSSHVVSI